MVADLAVSALVRRDAELAHEIEALEARLDQVRADLAHLHAAIRILDPDADPAAVWPKRPSRRGCAWFGHGELGRLMLDALREAPGEAAEQRGCGAGGHSAPRARPERPRGLAAR